MVTQIKVFSIFLLLAFSIQSSFSHASQPIRYHLESFSNLLNLAEEGDLLAQMEVGKRYYRGSANEGVEQSNENAIDWYTQAAEQGNPDAQFELAKLFHVSFRIPRDESRAIQWYELAAQQGHLESMKRLVTLYSPHSLRRDNHPNPERMLYWTRTGAELGEPSLQNSLGRHYESEAHEREDYHRAAKWYEKAANQGNENAQMSLAFLYVNDEEGLSQDLHLAFNWFKKAAEQDNPEAQERAGMLYAFGLGTEQNYFNAVEWFTKAAEQGRPFSQFSLGMLYLEGKGVRQSNESALHWFGLGCDNRHAQSCENYSALNRRENSG